MHIVLFLLKKNGDCASCAEVAPSTEMAKSTLSHHYRVLREAGLIRSAKKGVEHRNVLRREESDELFPGLLDLIVRLAAPCF